MPTAGENEFFKEQSEASRIKATIVFEYFKAWANIVGSAADKIAYVDFFCGPGVYDDGSPSTPVLILNEAISHPKLRTKLVTIFQDEKPEYIKKLKKVVNSMPNIGTLKYKPFIEAEELREEVVSKLKGITMIPSLVFLDPFGYAGITIDLLGTTIKDWGCDCIFFFNYNRINSAITNEAFVSHINLLFGASRAATMRDEVKSMAAADREVYILENLHAALKSVKGTYKIEFKFYQKDSAKTSHFLVMISKHPKGYAVMKEIMAKHGDTVNGIPAYCFMPTSGLRQLTVDYKSGIDELANKLRIEFAKKKLTVKEVFDQHHVGTPYIMSNYKKALLTLEAAGKVTVDVPAANRPKRNGEITLGESRIVSFK